MDREEINIVVVDDEKYVCNIIMEALDDFGRFRIHKFTDPLMAVEFIADNSVDLVLTDLVMGDHSGVQILEATLKSHPDAVVILMTGYPTVKTAISVLKKGGYDYLVKPFKLEDLKSTIMRGLEHQRIRRENVELRSQLELMKISDTLARGTSLSSLLALIVETSIRELSAEGASILLLDRKSGKYRTRCIAGDQSEKCIDEFLLGEGAHGALSGGKKRSRIYNEEITISNRTFKRSYIVYPLISKGANIGFLNLVTDKSYNFVTAGQKHLISLLVSTVAAAVENDFMGRNLQKSYLLTIKALANAVEARDRYTAGHTDRVYRLAKITARRMGWNNRKMVDLRTGCILHDIGKIGVPDAVLNKPGKFTQKEREIMNSHPELGAKILKGIPFLEPVIPYVISHHEQFDGSGYPNGLSGEEIPIEGRLLAVVDTFDAIMSDRPYRAGAVPSKAIDELKKFSGAQFDPEVVKAFLDAYNRGLINCRVLYGKHYEKEKPKKQTVPV
jgi:putative nucleotidyltransferase with HDIG domain